MVVNRIMNGVSGRSGHFAMNANILARVVEDYHHKCYSQA